MKFTITTILAATLATVSSATTLPPKFTLKFTTAGGTALDKYSHQVTRDGVYGQFLNIGPGSNQDQVPATLFAYSESGAYVTNIDGIPNWYLVVSSNGYAIFSSPEGYWGGPGSGFLGVNGAFSYDAGDGKGPQSLWKACPDGFFTQLWEVYWNPASTIQGCIPIGLTIVPL